MEIDEVNILINALINSIGNKTLCVEAKKFLRYCAYSLNRPIKKKKFLAVTRATRDVILKKPRSSGDENAFEKAHWSTGHAHVQLII